MSDIDRVRVSENREHFLRNNQPFYYLADTAWSVFTNATEENFTRYLSYRSQQGFTVIQINILPQCDRSVSPGGELSPTPFPYMNGTIHFDRIIDEYFDNAEKLLACVKDAGLIPNLVLLWCNYVPGTWMSKNLSGRDDMPLGFMSEYVAYAVKRFRKYNPLYMISGDTDFPDGQTTEFYLEALKTVKQHDPAALCTFHLTPDADLPERVVRTEELDYYMFQSGHGPEQKNPYMLANKFRNYPEKRPVVNGEPCYEGLNVVKEYRRFSRFDVRKAAWQSILSGANAGITYGAHGIWSWHHKGDHFDWKNVFRQPFTWETALRFPGADDYGVLKRMAVKYQLYAMNPADIVENPDTEVCAAIGKNGDFAVYLPYQDILKLRLDIRKYRLKAIALENGQDIEPYVFRAEEKLSEVSLMAQNSDALLIGVLND